MTTAVARYQQLVMSMVTVLMTCWWGAMVLLPMVLNPEPATWCLARRVVLRPLWSSSCWTVAMASRSMARRRMTVAASRCRRPAISTATALLTCWWGLITPTRTGATPAPAMWCLVSPAALRPNLNSPRWTAAMASRSTARQRMTAAVARCLQLAMSMATVLMICWWGRVVLTPMAFPPAPAMWYLARRAVLRLSLSFPH